MPLHRLALVLIGAGIACAEPQSAHEPAPTPVSTPDLAPTSSGPDAPPAKDQCDSSPRSGCWLPIPRTTAWLGAQADDPDEPHYDPDAQPHEGPVRQVTLEAFWVMRDEVGSSTWRVCEQKGACPSEEVDREGLLSTLAQPDSASYPINSVTWKGAAAFCAWRGARLPTADEWEITARGSDGRRWPWGDDPGCGIKDPALVPSIQREGAPAPARDEMLRGDCTQEGPSTKNGVIGESPSGVRGLAGSLWEWTSTAGASHGERWLRGGGWLESTAQGLRTTSALSMPEDAKLPDAGIRCVWGS